jgi:peroxiredoxin
MAVVPGTLANEDASTLTKVGDAVPAFTIETTAGQKLTPASLKGKVVLLNFFATWCGPCVAEMPHLQKLHEQFKDNDSFAMVSVGREHQADEVKQFAEKQKLTFPVAADPKREAYGLFAKQYIPRNYVIDGEGKIIFQSVGFSEPEFKQMTATIEKALQSAAAAKSAN